MAALPSSTSGSTLALRTESMEAKLTPGSNYRSQQEPSPGSQREYSEESARDDSGDDELSPASPYSSSRYSTNSPLSGGGDYSLPTSASSENQSEAAQPAPNKQPEDQSSRYVKTRQPSHVYGGTLVIPSRSTSNAIYSKLKSRKEPSSDNRLPEDGQSVPPSPAHSPHQSTQSTYRGKMRREPFHNLVAGGALDTTVASRSMPLSRPTHERYIPVGSYQQQHAASQVRSSKINTVQSSQPPFPRPSFRSGHSRKTYTRVSPENDEDLHIPPIFRKKTLRLLPSDPNFSHTTSPPRASHKNNLKEEQPLPRSVKRLRERSYLASTYRSMPDQGPRTDTITNTSAPMSLWYNHDQPKSVRNPNDEKISNKYKRYTFTTSQTTRPSSPLSGCQRSQIATPGMQYYSRSNRSFIYPVSENNETYFTSDSSLSLANSSLYSPQATSRSSVPLSTEYSRPYLYKRFSRSPIIGKTRIVSPGSGEYTPKYDSDYWYNSPDLSYSVTSYPESYFSDIHNVSRQTAEFGYHVASASSQSPDAANKSSEHDISLTPTSAVHQSRSKLTLRPAKIKVESPGGSLATATPAGNLRLTYAENIGFPTLILEENKHPLFTGTYREASSLDESLYSASPLNYVASSYMDLSGNHSPIEVQESQGQLYPGAIGDEAVSPLSSGTLAGEVMSSYVIETEKAIPIEIEEKSPLARISATHRDELKLRNTKEDGGSIVIVEGEKSPLFTGTYREASPYESLYSVSPPNDVTSSYLYLTSKLSIVKVEQSKDQLYTGLIEDRGASPASVDDVSKSRQNIPAETDEDAPFSRLSASPIDDFRLTRPKKKNHDIAKVQEGKSPLFLGTYREASSPDEMPYVGSSPNDAVFNDLDLSRDFTPIEEASKSHIYLGLIEERAASPASVDDLSKSKQNIPAETDEDALFSRLSASPTDDFRLTRPKKKNDVIARVEEEKSPLFVGTYREASSPDESRYSGSPLMDVISTDLDLSRNITPVEESSKSQIYLDYKDKVLSNSSSHPADDVSSIFLDTSKNHDPVEVENKMATLSRTSAPPEDGIKINNLKKKKSTAVVQEEKLPLFTGTLQEASSPDESPYRASPTNNASPYFTPPPDNVASRYLGLSKTHSPVEVEETKNPPNVATYTDSVLAVSSQPESSVNISILWHGDNTPIEEPVSRMLTPVMLITKPSEESVPMRLNNIRAKRVLRSMSSPRSSSVLVESGPLSLTQKTAKSEVPYSKMSNREFFEKLENGNLKILQEVSDMQKTYGLLPYDENNVALILPGQPNFDDILNAEEQEAARKLLEEKMVGWHKKSAQDIVDLVFEDIQSMKE